MPDVALMLGPVTLQSFELPAQINTGGRQRLAIHRLTDGQRVIDCLGRDDADISFRGIFSGPDASMRARLVDALRVAGDPLPLSWDVFFYTVILSRFEADYENPTWIPYRITCTVLRDEAFNFLAPAVSLLASLLDDVNAASAQAGGLQLDFSGVQSSLSADDATVLGSSNYAALQLGITGMQSSVGMQIGITESDLQSSMMPTDPTPQAAAASFMAAAQTAQRLAMLTATQAYVGRAAKNIANAST